MDDVSSAPALVGFELLHDWAERFPALEGGRLLLVAAVPALADLPRASALALNPNVELVLYVHDGVRLCVGKDALLGVLRAAFPAHVASSDVTLGSKRLAAHVLGDARRVVGFVAGEELRELKCRHPLSGELLPCGLDDEASLEGGAVVRTSSGAPVSGDAVVIREQLRAVGAWLAGA